MSICKIDEQVIAPTTNINVVTCSELVSVGIDVARDTLMICELYSDNKCKFREIKNTEVSIKRLAAKLKKMNYLGKIIMESTGRHHMIGAIVFSETNLDVRVINPLIAKKYATASIRKVKTDKRDSEILAEIGIKENNLAPSFNLTRNVLAMRKKMRLIYSIAKQLQNLTACTRELKKTLKALDQKLSPCEKQIFETIKLLKKQKRKLEQELENDICENKDNTEKAKRYDSIPGVTSYVAALATLVFKDEHSQSAKQWIAFTGMDISVRESGNWKGQGHLTKRGNDYLRTRFYTAAWGAVRHNERFKEYYEHLKDRNRKHREALIIIARKIIKIMFSLNKNNSMYDDAKPLFVA